METCKSFGSFGLSRLTFADHQHQSLIAKNGQLHKFDLILPFDLPEDMLLLKKICTELEEEDTLLLNKICTELEEKLLTE